MTIEEMLALEDYEANPCFSEKDRAAIAFAVEITANNRQMRRTVQERLKANLTDPEIVDLTLACYWYNFMNRFNGALDVDIDTEVPDELLDLMNATPGPEVIAASLQDR